ncbi:MAG: MFS transporter, partial [Rubricella sp.]
LNDSATNETRGQALSLYMIVQTLGIVVSQASINLADPAGWNLFVAMSVLVSISFAPILLTVSPAPPFAATKRMTMRELFDASPLGMMGAFLLGFVFAAMFGMGAVYGTEAGLGVGQISLLVAAFYVGGLLFQFPVGVISDRMDRRRLILFLTAGSFGATMLAWPFLDLFPVVLLLAGLIGGVANPLYALMIAHTADHLEPEDMAAASSGLLFVNGVGAVAGPFLVGGMMALVGPDGYFLFLGLLLGLIAAYTGYRMTRRAAVPVEESASFAPVMPQATPVAMEIATELAIEDLEENAARADDPA